MHLDCVTRAPSHPQGTSLRRTVNTDPRRRPARQRVRGRTADGCCWSVTRPATIDALTGEGLGIAFSAAELLVNCIAPTVLAITTVSGAACRGATGCSTAGVLYASAQTPLRSRIVPAANTNTFPGVFTGMVNGSPNTAAPIAWAPALRAPAAGVIRQLGSGPICLPNLRPGYSPSSPYRAAERTP